MLAVEYCKTKKMFFFLEGSLTIVGQVQHKTNGDMSYTVARLLSYYFCRQPCNLVCPLVRSVWYLFNCHNKYTK